MAHLSRQQLVTFLSLLTSSNVNFNSNGGLADPTFLLFTSANGTGIPEPTTLAMFTLGGALLAFARRKKIFAGRK